MGETSGGDPERRVRSFTIVDDGTGTTMYTGGASSVEMKVEITPASKITSASPETPLIDEDSNVSADSGDTANESDNL